MTAPRATMRLQFHRQFTFADAVELVPYLAALDVSHLYASPILAARPGSSHGYDVIDPTRINPELGGETGFRRLVGALRAAGLGIIVDIVPNHMAVGGADNEWWLDVLQHGRSSRYAKFFDIDWEPEDPALRGKVLLPILGQPYGAALSKGEISLAWNDTDDRYEARYFQHAIPISPDHRAEIERLALHAFDATTAHGRRRLHGLLERQHYRLAWWKTADDEINWRRFFDVNELAALRVEDDDVFEATHATLFGLYAEGLIDGFRIDHVDGLTDPGGYCGRLRSRLLELSPRRPPGAPSKPYLVVEKILGPGEELPPWDCDGTSGYDFMDQVSAVLHDPAGEAPLRRLWQTISGRAGDFAAEEAASRREILDRSFSAQLASCVAALHRLARADLSTRDISRAAIRRIMTEILVHLRVYRSYARLGAPSPADAMHLSRAVQAARRSCLRADRAALDQLAAWLGGNPVSDRAPDVQAIAIRTFQQLSAPLAAKAVEDTAFYRYGRLLSRLDVGFDAENFADGIAAFHRRSQARRERLPDAMLATATHDHKRGEDVRARLAVLSEVADAWAAAVEQWVETARPLLGRADRHPAPSPGDLAILLQTIVGAWPPDLALDDRVGRAAFADRLAAWQQKALREAKLATDWAAPNEPYETAARNVLMRLLAGEPTPDLIGGIAQFADRIARPGAANGLAQTLLKLTSPGVPDIYQGTEFWDFSLVDPDNRRPLDFAARRQAARSTASAADLAEHWRDGRLKQLVVRRALMLRRRWPDLFARGDYLVCDAAGERAEHVVAFGRRFGGLTALTLVSRLPTRLLGAGDALNIPPPAWEGTILRSPGLDASTPWHDVISGRAAVPIGASTPLSQLFDGLPVALLVSGEPSR
ncbi:MAG: malto-oligosyltrehalose synthase [Xanthobacteraceae bacterium]